MLFWNLFIQAAIIIFVTVIVGVGLSRLFNKNEEQ